MTPLNFRQREHKPRAPKPEEARLIRDTVVVLNAAGAEGLSTRDVLLMLSDPANNRKPAKSELPGMAQRGWFDHVAVRGEPVTRYGREVRPWLWYAEDRLPRAPGGGAPIDAMARLKTLAKAYRAEDAGGSVSLVQAVETAIEGIEP